MIFIKYVDARYNEDYEITKKELEWLGKRVGRLHRNIFFGSLADGSFNKNSDPWGY